jgi:Bacteriophage head to tail connecting protein
VLRWSCPDNCTYGVPPTLSVLGKAIQLQNLEYQSDQGLDKMISPPMLVHTSMKNRPKAFGARGITYTNDLSSTNGARPAYNVQMPFQEMEVKRQRIVQAIKDGCYNYLFNMISDLDTVRSATEIDARREERMIVLGPVLQRGYVEDIGVIVKRVYGIAVRKGVLAPMPEGEAAEIEFSNILSEVQKASDVATLERFTAFAGQVIPAWPEVQAKVNILDIMKQYAEGLGVRPTAINDDEAVQQAVAPENEMAQLQQVSEVAKNFGAAGASLGKVDVGGGLNAVQSLLS